MRRAVIKESVLIGIATLIVGQLVGFILGNLMKVDTPKECKEWNKNHIMEWSLFFTGVLVHILSEKFGMNKWYCKYGSACSF